jgi:hypothetical protein
VAGDDLDGRQSPRGSGVVKTYDEWKATEPDYWDYDDRDPRDDPVVQLELLLHNILSSIKTLEKFAAQDRYLVYGALPDIHEAYTGLGLILMQFPDTLPRAAE